MNTPTCPACGSNDFDLTVTQTIGVAFQGGDHEVVADPHGDMDWDEDTEAACRTCGHCAALGQMKTSQLKTGTLAYYLTPTLGLVPCVVVKVNHGIFADVAEVRGPYQINRRIDCVNAGEHSPIMPRDAARFVQGEYRYDYFEVIEDD